MNCLPSSREFGGVWSPQELGPCLRAAQIHWASSAKSLVSSKLSSSRKVRPLSSPKIHSKTALWWLSRCCRTKHVKSCCVHSNFKCMSHRCHHYVFSYTGSKGSEIPIEIFTMEWFAMFCLNAHRSPIFRDWILNLSPKWDFCTNIFPASSRLSPQLSLRNNPSVL